VAGIDKPLHAKHKRFRPAARDGAWSAIDRARPAAGQPSIDGRCPARL